MSSDIYTEINVYSANSYNIRHIGELLFQLLMQALKYYPCNVPWLRLMGDLNFGTFHFIKYKYQILYTILFYIIYLYLYFTHIHTHTHTHI